MIKETLSFLLFSFIIIVPLTIWMMKKKRKISQIIIYNTFIVYIFGAIAQICLPIHYSGRPIVENIKSFPYSEFIYITPFKQEYFDMYATDAVLRLIKSYILNIILTIPFGVLFPLMKRSSTRSMILIAVLVGLSAETIQLLIGMLFGNQYRVTHIDDVIMNAIAVMLGYILIKVFTRKYNYLSVNY